MKIIQVDWEDACGNLGKWYDKENVDAFAARFLGVTSVGWEVRNDKKQIILALSKSESGDFGALLQIPRPYVKKVTVLKK